MKNEITIGQALSILVTLLVVLIGWGVSVEVRLATAKTQIEQIIEIKSMVEEIHEQVIRHDEKFNNLRK